MYMGTIHAKGEAFTELQLSTVCKCTYIHSYNYTAHVCIVYIRMYSGYKHTK